jgi:hypothetical protein
MGNAGTSQSEKMSEKADTIVQRIIHQNQAKYES